MLPPSPAPPRLQAHLAQRAARALAGRADAVALAALLDAPVHPLQRALAQAGPGAAELDAPTHPAAPMPAAALEAVETWRAAEPVAAQAALARALRWLTARREGAQAARVALAFGDAAQRLALVRATGWAMLWRSEQPLLGALLDSLATLPEPEQAPVASLRLAWWIEVERLPHEAERWLARNDTLPLPERWLAQARLAQVFDDPRRAVALAEAAAAGFPSDLQPAALLVPYALGCGLLDAARPREALAPLAHLLRAAARDDLPLLVLQALALLARCHDELGDFQARDATLQAAPGWVPGAPPPGAHGLRSLQRLARAAALRRTWPGTAPAGDASAADAPAGDALAGDAPGGDASAGDAPADDAPALAVASAQPLGQAPAAAAADDRDAFPDLALQALQLMLAGDAGAAQPLLRELDRRRSLAFHCAKWRHEQRYVQLWAAARRPPAPVDAASPAARTAPRAPVAPPSLAELHEAVLDAAARALGIAGADAPDCAAAAPGAALEQTVQGSGLGLLQRRLWLVQALDAHAAAPARPTAAMAEPLLRWLHQARASGEVQDAFWLAPKLAAALQALLAWPELVHHAQARELALRLLDALQAAPPAVATQHAGAAIAPPPADLTPREWQILQLIGRRYTNEQIALRLGVSLATVKTHINRVYGKLAIASRAEAVQRARHFAAAG